MMTTRMRSFCPHRKACVAIGITSLLLTASSVRAQLTPGDINQIRGEMGDRIEATTILSGDFGMEGASFNTGNSGDLKLEKFGGAGDIGDPKPLGNLPIGWQPRLQGEMGYLSADDKFSAAYPDLHGSESKFRSFAIQFGGGARLWFDEHLSIAPTIMGMYGHTENTFYPHSAVPPAIVTQARQEGLVDWSADTWTIRPAANIQYVYTWRRTVITLSSDPTYFHTESFHTSNPGVSVNGDSETWENKIDVDVPLGKSLWGHELRTGGYFSRTELMGNLKQGLNNNDYLYEIHGRLVLDYLNQLWKVQWIGIGYSYLWGRSFDGYSLGLDIAFRF